VGGGVFIEPCDEVEAAGQGGEAAVRWHVHVYSPCLARVLDEKTRPYIAVQFAIILLLLPLPRMVCTKKYTILDPRGHGRKQGRGGRKNCPAIPLRTRDTTNRYMNPPWPVFTGSYGDRFWPEPLGTPSTGATQGISANWAARRENEKNCCMSVPRCHSPDLDILEPGMVFNSHGQGSSH